MNAVIYIMLATGMFYFTDGAFQAGGFGFMYMYLFGLGIIALGLVSLLVTPKIKRTVLLLKYSGWLSLSYLITVLISTIIWVFSFAAFRTMTAGFFSVIYQLIGLGVAVATLYLFGEKGIWYCLVSMCLANTLIVFQVMQEGGGPALFLQEFVTLILTFGADTGTMMGNVEIHDLTFAFGPFAIYLIWRRKEMHYFLLPMFLTVLFLMVGLKRIEVGAILLPLFICLLIKARKKEPDGAILTVGILLMLIGFLYVIFIRFGLFYFLEEVLGLDTKGRNMIYQYLNTQYEISPFYFGKGLGFDRLEWEQTGMIWNRIGQDAYHNEFLRMYIELGFVGFFIWLWFHFAYRLRRFSKRQGGDGGLLCLAYMIYLFITYLTDNTLFYYYTNVTIFLLLMSYQMEELEKEELIQYD